jgi:hypothetical protein
VLENILKVTKKKLRFLKMKLQIKGLIMNIKNYSKIDHKTLHFLPVLPSRKRNKGFALTREWGNRILDITARETLNTYDLLTLLYIVKEYILNGFKAGYIGMGKDKREVAGIKIDVKKFLLNRGILNKKANRNTLKKSIMRLKSIDLVYTNKETRIENYTSYIYEFDVDKDIKEITIYANKKFIEFVIKNGILINLERLKLYGEKEQYAILLDLYLQGTKIEIKKKNKKIYIYREKFTNEEIEQALKLDITNMRQSDKRLIIKKTFELIHEKGNMPLYIYDKNKNMWIKTFEIENNEKGKLQP